MLEDIKVHLLACDDVISHTSHSYYELSRLFYYTVLVAIPSNVEPRQLAIANHDANRQKFGKTAHD